MKKKNELDDKELTTTHIVKIPSLELEKAKITIKGISPLMVNKFSEKSKTEINDKQEGKAKNKKAAKNPEEEYLNSIYFMPGSKSKYGVPSSGIKHMAVSACKFVDGIKMTVARGAFHVIAGPGGLTEITTSGPTMDASIVRIGKFGSKVPTTRYRARFDDWAITFPIIYNKRVISAEQIANLYENAGFSIGLCEWRPEKNGSFGMFEVKKS